MPPRHSLGQLISARLEVMREALMPLTPLHAMRFKPSQPFDVKNLAVTVRRLRRESQFQVQTSGSQKSTASGQAAVGE